MTLKSGFPFPMLIIIPDTNRHSALHWGQSLKVTNLKIPEWALKCLFDVSDFSRLWKNRSAVRIKAITNLFQQICLDSSKASTTFLLASLACCCLAWVLSPSDELVCLICFTTIIDVNQLIIINYLSELRTFTYCQLWQVVFTASHFFLVSKTITGFF